jgi:hypothetical protein
MLETMGRQRLLAQLQTTASFTKPEEALHQTFIVPDARRSSLAEQSGREISKQAMVKISAPCGEDNSNPSPGIDTHARPWCCKPLVTELPSLNTKGFGSSEKAKGTPVCT